jgi:hypothetical protein
MKDFVRGTARRAVLGSLVALALLVGLALAGPGTARTEAPRTTPATYCLADNGCFWAVP